MADEAKTTRSRTHRVGSNGANPEVEIESDDINLLEELEEYVSQDVEAEPVAYIIPNRPKMSLVFRTDLDFDTWNTWVKRCTNRKTKETDHAQLSYILISNLNVGIKMNGVDRRDRDGEPITVASASLHKSLKVPAGGTKAAIRKLYASDGHMIQTMQQLVEKCGYAIDGDVVEEDGPLAD